MFRPELYDEHNASLDRFIEQFNSCTLYKNFIMLRNPEENHKADGFFIDFDTGNTMGFDWTKSSKSIYKDGTFLYNDICIFDSKLYIETNILVIETDCEENYFSVVFVDDLKQSPQSFFTDHVGGEKIRRAVRKTKQYKTYPYTDIDNFKAMTHEAISKKTYNHTIWR